MISSRRSFLTGLGSLLASTALTPTIALNTAMPSFEDYMLMRLSPLFDKIAQRTAQSIIYGNPDLPFTNFVGLVPTYSRFAQFATFFNETHAAEIWEIAPT